MSDHAVPTAIDAPSQKQGRSRIGRLLPRYGMATVAAGLAVTILTATAASAAEPLTNGPTIQLGTYNNIPASAPAYQNSPDWAEDPAGLFPVNNGALGNAVNMFMTGESGDYTSNNTYALGIPGGSTTWGTQVSTALYTGATSQEWFFQRVGYVGVTTPLTTEQNKHDWPGYGNTQDLAVPVYRILNYNPNDPSVGFTCLGSQNEFGAAGSIVESQNCNPNPPAQTAGNQLWIIGSPWGPDNNVIDYTTGAFINPEEYLLPEVYNDYLQSNAIQIQSGSNEGADSVIENVASLWNNNWDTSAVPVLSATYTNLPGINSGLQLAAAPSLASYSNSTWNLVPAYTPAAPSTNNPNSSCSGLSGYSVLYCGIT